VGDLSGKHGKLNGPVATFSYVDDFLSLHEGDAGFIGGRSVVIHRADKTRFVCAKYLQYYDETNYSITEATDGVIPEVKCPIPVVPPSPNVTTTCPPSQSTTSTMVVPVLSSPTGVPMTIPYTTNTTTTASAGIPPVFTGAASRDSIQRGGYFLAAAAGVLALL
jgi:hypothetical protein